MTCEYCQEEICAHGNCYCSDEPCFDCARRRNLETDADREVAWQRDVIGPLCGFTEEDQ